MENYNFKKKLKNNTYLIEEKQTQQLYVLKILFFNHLTNTNTTTIQQQQNEHVLIKIKREIETLQYLNNNTINNNLNNNNCKDKLIQHVHSFFTFDDFLSFHSSSSSSSTTTSTTFTTLTSSSLITNNNNNNNNTSGNNQITNFNSTSCAPLLALNKEVKLFLVMEYCDKGNLEDLIKIYQKKNLQFSFDFILQITKELLFILKDLHLQNIIHKNIKPKNIYFKINNLQNNKLNLLKNENLKSFIVKLGNFGFTKDLDDFNRSTFFVENLQYMSPELFLTKNYTPSNDIWCLGVTILKMFAFLNNNNNLYNNNNMDNNLYNNNNNNMDNNNIPDLRNEIKKNTLFIPTLCQKFQVPKLLEEILSCCFIYDAKERPTAQELIEFIEHYESLQISLQNSLQNSLNESSSNNNNNNGISLFKTKIKILDLSLISLLNLEELNEKNEISQLERMLNEKAKEFWRENGWEKKYSVLWLDFCEAYLRFLRKNLKKKKKKAIKKAIKKDIKRYKDLVGAVGGNDDDDDGNNKDLEDIGIVTKNLKEFKRIICEKNSEYVTVDSFNEVIKQIGFPFSFSLLQNSITNPSNNNTISNVDGMENNNNSLLVNNSTNETKDLLSLEDYLHAQINYLESILTSDKIANDALTTVTEDDYNFEEYLNSIIIPLEIIQQPNEWIDLLSNFESENEEEKRRRKLGILENLDISKTSQYAGGYNTNNFDNLKFIQNGISYFMYMLKKRNLFFIIGKEASGKSLLLKLICYFMSRMSYKYSIQTNYDFLIPLYVPVKYLVNDGLSNVNNLLQFKLKCIKAASIIFNENYTDDIINYLLSKWEYGKLLLLFDGFDEITCGNEYYSIIEQYISLIIKKKELGGLIITSRTNRYQNVVDNNFTVMKMLPLDFSLQKQIAKYRGIKDSNFLYYLNQFNVVTRMPFFLNTLIDSYKKNIIKNVEHEEEEEQKAKFIGRLINIIMDNYILRYKLNLSKEEKLNVFEMLSLIAEILHKGMLRAFTSSFIEKQLHETNSHYFSLLHQQQSTTNSSSIMNSILELWKFYQKEIDDEKFPFIKRLGNHYYFSHNVFQEFFVARIWSNPNRISMIREYKKRKITFFSRKETKNNNTLTVTNGPNNTSTSNTNTSNSFHTNSGTNSSGTNNKTSCSSEGSSSNSNYSNSLEKIIFSSEMKKLLNNSWYRETLLLTSGLMSFDDFLNFINFIYENTKRNTFTQIDPFLLQMIHIERSLDEYDNYEEIEKNILSQKKFKTSILEGLIHDCPLLREMTIMRCHLFESDLEDIVHYLIKTITKNKEKTKSAAQSLIDIYLEFPYENEYRYKMIKKLIEAISDRQWKIGEAAVYALIKIVKGCNCLTDNQYTKITKKLWKLMTKPPIDVQIRACYALSLIAKKGDLKFINKLMELLLSETIKDSRGIERMVECLTNICLRGDENILSQLRSNIKQSQNKLIRNGLILALGKLSEKGDVQTIKLLIQIIARETKNGNETFLFIMDALQLVCQPFDISLLGILNRIFLDHINIRPNRITHLEDLEEFENEFNELCFKMMELILILVDVNQKSEKKNRNILGTSMENNNNCKNNSVTFSSLFTAKNNDNNKGVVDIKLLKRKSVSFKMKESINFNQTTKSLIQTMFQIGIYTTSQEVLRYTSNTLAMMIDHQNDELLQFIFEQLHSILFKITNQPQVQHFELHSIIYFIGVLFANTSSNDAFNLLYEILQIVKLNLNLCGEVISAIGNIGHKNDLFILDIFLQYLQNTNPNNSNNNNKNNHHHHDHHHDRGRSSDKNNKNDNTNEKEVWKFKTKIILALSNICKTESISEKIIPILLTQLEYSNSSKYGNIFKPHCIQMISKLCKKGDKDIISKFITMINDKDPLVRKAIAKALGNVCEKTITPLMNNNNLNNNSSNSLNNNSPHHSNNNKNILKALKELLEDENNDVKYEALSSLENLSDLEQLITNLKANSSEIVKNGLFTMIIEQIRENRLENPKFILNAKLVKHLENCSCIESTFILMENYNV
ncbi:hypothetical protein ABK040_007994 [Willaertia magna]